MPFDRLQRQLVAALRQHLATGQRPVLPEAGDLLWSMFCDLSMARGYTMAGPQPIAYSEILAWAQLHRWPLQAHHVAILRAMDDAWLSAGRQPKDKAAPRRPSGNVNPNLFDAVFGQ